MAINFRCGQCGKLLQAADEAAGRIVACPGCAAQLPVPGVTPESPAAPMVPAARPAAARPVSAAGAPQPFPQPQALPEPQPFVTTHEPAAGSPRLRRRKSPDKRVLLIVAGGAVLLLAAVVGAMLMLGGGGSGGRSISRAVHYLPDDAETVFSVNVSSVTKSKLWQKLEQHNAVKRFIDEMHTEINMTPADIVRVTGGANRSSKRLILIVETRKKLEPKTIFKGPGSDADYKEEKIAGHTVYVPKSGSDMAAYMPTDTTLVAGPKPVLQAVLERKGDPPAKVRSLADQLKPSAAVSLAFRPPDEAAGMRGPMPGADDLTKGVESIAVHAEVSSDVRVSANVVCKDSEKAKKLKTQVDEQVGQLAKNPAAPPPVREMLQKTKVSQSGPQLNTEVTISEAMIDQFIGMAAMMGGSGIGGGPDMPPPAPTRPPRAKKPPRLGET